MKQRKLQLATDFYQFTISNVYKEMGFENRLATFDVFIRSNPFKGGYTVFAGLEQIIEYVESFRFDAEDIDMLHRNHPEFTDGFLDYLKDMSFTGEISAFKEGSIVFPQEPLVRVKAPIIQAQIMETALLAIVNHQSLIATKASRVCQAAGGDTVLDFGMRRAHGIEAGLYGARAAIIGGCAGTSNVEAEYRFDVVSKGTMSHAYVMSFSDEYTAYYEFSKLNPGNVIVLVDTYDTLNSGVPNAIKLFDQMKKEGTLKGKYGIRLDSGDLAYLSSMSRKMLDDAGYPEALISASSDLDEYLIQDLKQQGASINLWGVGTKMITAYDCPALGAVYKMSQITEPDGTTNMKMKISDDPFKITNPGYKKVMRLYNKSTGKATADLITLDEEVIDNTRPLKIFHPFFTFKQRVIEDFYAKEMLTCIYKDGKLVYDNPSIGEIADYHKQEKDSFWQENLRFTSPNEYHVDLSDKLYDIKKNFIREHTSKK